MLRSCFLSSFVEFRSAVSEKKSKCLSQSEAWEAILFFLSAQKTNLVGDVEILLPVKFDWILFSGFREEVENVSANQRSGRPSCFSDQPEKYKLGRGHWDIASYQVSLNSVQRFQRRSRKCEKLTTDGRRVITIEHLSLRLRCTKKDIHSLYLQCFQQRPFVKFSKKSYKLKIPTEMGT